MSYYHDNKPRLVNTRGSWAASLLPCAWPWLACYAGSTAQDGRMAVWNSSVPGEIPFSV